MTFRNTQTSYGWLTIALHWTAAIGFIWLFLSGREVEIAFEAGAKREALVPLVRYHVSIGLCFIVFLAARVYLHYSQAQPEHLPQRRSLTILSKVVQQLLLIIIMIQIITGPLIIWLSGNPLRLFDLYMIPSPFPELKGLHRIIEVTHIVTSKFILPVFALHILGVLKHLIIDRDHTLQRILWVRKDD